MAEAVDQLRILMDDFLKKNYPGESKAADQVRRAMHLANQPAAIALRQPVLFLGESGTGKGYAAELTAAHRRWLELGPDEQGAYVGRPAIRPVYSGLIPPPVGEKWTALTLTRFQSVLLPGIPETLLESELFGHKKGSFTGAQDDREGIFGSDEVTDVLLDEIGDASLSLQAKLLEVIETGEFRPVGASLGEKGEAQARPILATNRDLGSLVRSGAFREDLYWRISQVVITIPPLREQRDLIEEIINSVRSRILGGVSDSRLRRSLAEREFTGDDFAWAKLYEWPGNVRELTRLVRIWSMHPEKASLKAVHDEMPVTNPWSQEGSAERQLRSSVIAWCSEVKHGRRAAPGTVEQLLTDITSVAKEAMSSEVRTADDSTALFPRQSVDNVRSRMSKWRRSAR